MSEFYIINENTEDTIGETDNLDDAIRVAREAARRGQTGDPVSILENRGKAVMQFILMPDGKVAEQPIAPQLSSLAWKRNGSAH
jgi:hypothetical protein